MESKIIYLPELSPTPFADCNWACGVDPAKSLIIGVDLEALLLEDAIIMHGLRTDK